MPRVTFSVEDLQREMSVYARKSTRSKQRLAEWRDDEPGHAQREVVLTRGKLRLFHYAPRVHTPMSVPLLVVYALVNRPYMADLMPDCSLIGDLLDSGLDIYLIDWGYPDSTDRRRTLEEYIVGDLDACIDWIRAAHQCEQIDLLGICQGGTFSLCYSALYGVKVRSLITTVTPVDFHTSTDLLSHLIRRVDATALVAAYGNIAGDFLNTIFLAQKPLQLTQQKYVDFIEHADNDSASALFLAMEKWIFDSPALAGEAFREFAQGCYQDNGLAKGTLRIGSRAISLENLKMPILNIFARDDHLVPPAASRALRELVGTDEYTEVELPGGHIGIYVSARARAQLVAATTSWIGARETPVTPTKRGNKKLP